MKKIISILSAFLGVGFLICFILGLCIPVTVDIPSKSIFGYKFCTGMEYFLSFLPAMVFSGILIGCSVHFGHNSENTDRRFSSAIIKKYKSIMIISIICTLILSLANETFGLLIKQRKENLVNRPKIINEYIDVGNALFKEGLYDRSLMYAEAALKLDPSASAARDLKSRSDMEINREKISDLRFDLEAAEPLHVEDNSLIIDSQKIADAYQCLLKAVSAYDQENWFDAHYYSEMGIKLASSKDPNVQRLKELSAESWNNLTEEHKSKKSEAQLIFDQKYQGYVSLMENDDLQAYYIFRYLDETYPEMKRDKDLQFYFEIAKKRIEQKYFFIDETLELETFENANDVYFSNTRIDGTTDIVYFKGMTMIKDSGQSIQYLRDFTIVTLKNGQWLRTMHVPYAKVMPVSVKNLNEATKSMLEITNETDYVPYILLKSIGRDDKSQISTPLYTYASGEQASTPEYMIYPLSYTDFLLMEETTANPNTLSLVPLYNLAANAKKFGFSEQVFGHIMLNRMLYPLYMLVLLMFFAYFAWNYRIGYTLYFRMSWVLSFPIFIAMNYIFYAIVMFLFNLINYVLVGLCGTQAGLFAGIGLYVFMLIISSLLFLSRRNNS